MIVADRTVEAADLSHAWADVISILLDAKSHRVANLTIRIADPTAQVPEIRRIADEVLADLKKADVIEVANTIFPSEWAADLPVPAELAADYRELYPFLKSLGNGRGTYFGRLVAFPNGNEGAEIDQLSGVVAKILDAQEKKEPVFKCAYELNVYSCARDRNPKRGFPCLSHLGLHIGPDDRLNATAHYRSHDALEKGYGNYLGLCGLLKYISAATERECGEMMIIAGGAFLSQGSIKRLKEAREQIDALQTPST
jgi:thymidylate synthase